MVPKKRIGRASPPRIGSKGVNPGGLIADAGMPVENYIMSQKSEKLIRLSSEFASDPEMADLVEVFISELPDRLKTLEEVWAGAKFDELKRISHQLKGASAGYGFSVIGVAAGSLEGTLNRVQCTPDLKTLATMKTQFDELVTLCRRAAA